MIASDKDLVLKKDFDDLINNRCNKHDISFAIMGEELKNIKKMLEKLSIFQDTFFDKLDSKYAGKYVEQEIEKLKNKGEQRTYNWFSQLILVVIGVFSSIITALILKSVL